MISRRQFYQALSATPDWARAQQSGGDCPSAGWLDAYPGSLSPESLRHVTFCQHCQETLRAARGVAFVTEATPNMSPQRRALNRAVRWDGLKAQLAALLDTNLTALTPQPGFVRTGAAALGQTVTPELIPLNLSARSSLSAADLTLTIEEGVEPGLAMLTGSGFVPELIDHEILLLVLPRIMIEDFLGLDEEISTADLPLVQRLLQSELEAGAWESPDNPLLLGAALALTSRLELAVHGAAAQFTCPASLLPLVRDPANVLTVIVS